MRNHTIKYLLAEVITKALPFLLIPYFTSKLGASGYGELSLFQVYFNFFIVFITIGGDTLLTRVVFRYGKLIFNEFSLFLILTYFVIFLVLSIPIIFFGTQLYFFSIICALGFVINNVFLIRFQSLSQSSCYLLSQILSSVLSTGLTFILFELYLHEYQSRAIAIFLSYAAVIFIFMIYELDNLRVGIYFFKRIKIYLSMFFIAGSPMLLHKLSFFIRNQLDRVVVSNYFSDLVLGIYSLSAQLVSILPVVFTAINMALYPLIYAKLKSNPQIVFAKIDKSIPIIFLLCTIMSLFIFKIPERFYILLFGYDFDGVGDFFPILFFGNSLQLIYLLLSTVVLYYLKTKTLAFCTVFSSIIHLSALYFVAPYGIKYIPYVVVLSNVTSLMLVYLICYLPLKKTICE